MLKEIKGYFERENNKKTQEIKRPDKEEFSAMLRKHCSVELLTMNDGRKLTLGKLYQDATYSCMLEGVPGKTGNQSIVKSAMERAMRELNKGNPVALVPPAASALVLPIKMHECGYYPEPELLPRICCMASFESGKPSGKPGSESYYNSTVTAVWFQNELAFPISEETVNFMKELDWSKYAWDWCD